MKQIRPFVQELPFQATLQASHQTSQLAILRGLIEDASTIDDGADERIFTRYSMFVGGFRWRLGLALAVMVQTGLAAPPAASKAEDQSPQQLATNWWAARKDSGLVLVEQMQNGGFRQHADARHARLQLNQHGYRVSLGLTGPIRDDMTLTQVRKLVKYVALDKLPTPGLEVAKWEFIPRTPRSSIRKGIELLDYRDGRIVLRVKTKLFALNGRDTSVEVPMDAGMPKGSYLQVREPRQLDLTLSCPAVLE